MEAAKDNPPDATEEKPFLSVLMHSFFVIPFLIAVFCLLLFAAMYLLTSEKRSVYDYLEDVKIGGMTKRWQGAFELSKMLSNPKLVPTEEKFTREMIHAFKESIHDDNRVRQYLALAMGKTGRKDFLPVLTEALADEKEDNLAPLIYAIGSIREPSSAPALFPFMEHNNPRVRSVTATALGNIGSENSINILRKALNDHEPNVQWGSALSLARMGDATGQQILLNLLDREYLNKFPEVDPNEQNDLMLAVIDAAQKINSEPIRQQIKILSQSDKNMNIRSAALKFLSS
jgi:hypothetical protein